MGSVAASLVVTPTCAAGSDGIFHAFCTDINNVQNVVWWYGLEFTPTIIHQQEVVTGSGNL